MSRRRPSQESASGPPQRPRRKWIAALAVIASLAAVGLLWPHWSAYRHWILGEAAAEELDFKSASEHFRAFAAVYPNSAQGQYKLAQSLRREGNYREAESQIEGCQWVPELVELEKAMLEVQQYGTNRRAGELLEKTVQVRHPEERLLLEAMVQGDRHVMNLEQAGAWLNVWVDHFPEDWVPRLWRAELMMSFKHFKEARADYLKLLELRPDRKETYLKLGELALADSSDYAQAEAYFLHFLEGAPNNSEAWLGMARCRHGQGQLEEALIAVQKVLQQQPEHGEACLLMATIAIDEGRYQESLEWLAKAERTEADRLKVHYQFAQVLNRLGRHTEAAAHEQEFKQLREANTQLEEAVTQVIKNPSDPQRHHDMGVLFVQIGNDKAAERWFLSALHQNRSFTASHEALADLYARRAGSGDSAMAELHRRMANAGR